MAVSPRKTTNAKVDSVGRRVKTAGEGAYASFADKTITPVMERYAKWLTEQTGYKVDPMSVQLGSALRGPFQKSDFNQSRIAERAEERAAEAQAKLDRAAEREAAKAAKEAARTEKAAAKAAAPKVAKTVKPATKAAPAKAAAKKPAAKVAAKTPLASRRRPASASTKQSDF